MSTDVPSTVERPMRADGRRNRELVLAAARASFAERGPDVAVAEIAKRAGVGSATLFRHFPTKDDLVAAVLEQMFEQIASGVKDALAMDDPWESFVRSITVVAELQSTDQLFLRSAGPEVLSQERFADTMREMTDNMDRVIARAKDAGVVRADLESTDLSFMISAIGGATEHCCAPVVPDDQWRRYLGIILDGLRPEGAHPLSPAPLSYEQILEIKKSAKA